MTKNSFTVLLNNDIDDPWVLSNKIKEIKRNNKKAEKTVVAAAAKKQATATSSVATATAAKENGVSYRKKMDEGHPRVGSVSWRSLGNHTLEDPSNRNKSRGASSYSPYDRINIAHENMIHEQVLKKFAKFLENNKSNDNSGGQEKASRGRRGRKDKNGDSNGTTDTTEAPSVQASLPQEPPVDDVQAKSIENVIIEDNASSIATNEEVQKEETTEYEVVNKNVLLEDSGRSNYTAREHPLVKKTLEREVMTLQEYLQIVEEKRKALPALDRSEERKAQDESEFENMQQLSRRKESDEFFIKPSCEKKGSGKQKSKQVKKSIGEIAGSRTTGAREVKEDQAPTSTTSASDTESSDGDFVLL